MENQKEKPEDEKTRLLYRISRMNKEKAQRDDDILAMEKRIAEITNGMPKKARTVGIILWKEQAEAICKALNLVMAGDKAHLVRNITFMKGSAEGRDKVHVSFEMPEANE